MKHLQWFKVQVGLFADPKVRSLLSQPNGDSYFTIWLLLKDLAGMVNDHGYIYTSSKTAITVEELARHFGRRRKFMEKVLAQLAFLELVDRDEDGMLRVLTWDEDQDYEKSERRRENNRRNVAAYRKRKAAEQTQQATEEHGQPSAAEAPTPVAETDGVEARREEKQRLTQTMGNKKPQGNTAPAESVKYYQQNFGMVNSRTAEELREAEGIWGADVVCDAIDTARLQGKSHIAYIKGILRNSPIYTKEERENEYGFSPAVARKLNQLLPKTSAAD